MSLHPAAVDYYKGGARSEYFRLLLDLDTGVVQYRRLLPRTMEFPVINPDWTARPARHTYLVGDIFGQDVQWGPAQVGVYTHTHTCACV